MLLAFPLSYACACDFVKVKPTLTGTNGKSKIFFYAKQVLPDFSEEPNQPFVPYCHILAPCDKSRVRSISLIILLEGKSR